MALASQYGESLPASCPPEGASEGSLESVFRLVASDPPTPKCFDSHRALGKPFPKNSDLTECDWASCSLNKSVEELVKLKRLRMRFPYVAELSVPEGVGRHVSGKYHIHFWRFNGVNMVSFVTKVDKL